ncbi:MAG TPA: biopolymer transporter ExbD [Acidobacteriaceae bacterium]|nr:biopolymer transporter ExbD [Acidobacteriaceae bacterium]
MSMASGGSGCAVSEINVTPLIDVLLVLLIIFMVIVPARPRGLNALIPRPAKEKTRVAEDSRTVVVQVEANGAGETTYKINADTFAKADVEPKLMEIFSTRAEKVMFVQGSSGLEFGKVAEVVDMGHRANVENIGIMTPRVIAAQ